MISSVEKAKRFCHASGLMESNTAVIQPLIGPHIVRIYEVGGVNFIDKTLADKLCSLKKDHEKYVFG